MKRIYLLPIFLFTVFTSFSQDTLFTRDGEKIYGRVIEIKSNDVVYKAPDDRHNQYSYIAQSKLSSIHYSNGTSDIFINPQDTSYHNGTVVTNGYNTAEAGSSVPPADQNPNPGYSNRSPNNNAFADAAVIGIRVIGVILRIALAVALDSQCHNNHSSYSSSSHSTTSHPRGH